MQRSADGRDVRCGARHGIGTEAACALGLCQGHSEKKQKEREDRPFKTLNTLNGSLPSFFSFLFRPLVDTRWILCFDRFVSCQGQEGAEQSHGGVGGHGVREG